MLCIGVVTSVYAPDVHVHAPACTHNNNNMLSMRAQPTPYSILNIIICTILHSPGPWQNTSYTAGIMKIYQRWYRLHIIYDFTIDIDIMAGYILLSAWWYSYKKAPCMHRFHSDERSMPYAADLPRVSFHPTLFVLKLPINLSTPPQFYTCWTCLTNYCNKFLHHIYFKPLPGQFVHKVVGNSCIMHAENKLPRCPPNFSHLSSVLRLADGWPRCRRAPPAVCP